MALWLVRAGSMGEYEEKFIQENKVYLTWEVLSADLSKIEDEMTLYQMLLERYKDTKSATARNWTGQVWAFVKKMNIGDWIVLPSKKKASIHIAEITGDYVNVPKNPDPFYHYRTVKWIAKDIPRSNFDQDMLYSFGAFMTICQVKRNDAEDRIKAMKNNNWHTSVNIADTGIDQEALENTDFEQLAKDEIAKYIIQNFKGHGMAKLIESILKAQGFSTYRSPEGPDQGIDILAAPGLLGFGSPKICVQVKTGDSQVDRPTLDQLLGTMQNVNAEQGLLVSWSGFKNSVNREMVNKYFRIRFWDQKSIIEAIIDNYDKLDEDVRAELPLKRIWTLAKSELL